MKTLRDEQPATEDQEELGLTRSALTIDGADAAMMALDVMVNSMVALSATEDEDATDALIGSCVDAARVYETGSGAMRAALQRQSSDIGDLKHAFDAGEEVDLRNSVEWARAWLDDMSEHVDAGIEQPGPSKRPQDVGVAVEVRDRFVGKWCHGFEVVDHVEGGYVIRRVSDWALVPEVIMDDDVRSDRRN